MPDNSPLEVDIARHIWDIKYRFRDQDCIFDSSITDTWVRVGSAVAAAESVDSVAWEKEFKRILDGFRFLPAGRIQAGAGTQREVTLFNCFVMGVLADSLDGIFDGLKEGARTMQQGGGVGYDFSTLRPRGMAARRVGSVASGPVSFMGIWDSMCATLLSTGARRGAMMATLRCDHPDIETFIAAKHTPGTLSNFNLSVQVTDAFIDAVRTDADWPLVFPLNGGSGDGETLMRAWTGAAEPIPCRVVREVRARVLWERIMRGAYEYGEPGVLFVDRINEQNNLWYREYITTSNPCGEVPLPPYGACNLGSVNLTRFVDQPFSPGAGIDLEGIEKVVRVAVRFMDNVIDASGFPLERQAEQARGSRRVGLGITGLADALIMLGLDYSSEAARQQAEAIMARICHTAYRSSIELARERGPFPFFEPDRYLESRFVERLPADIRAGIARHGIRNSHLTAIAPTGTTSLLANAVSSGIEPVYDFTYQRRIREADGSDRVYPVSDYALRLWRKLKGDEVLPETFVRAWDVSPEDHLAMQACLQPYVDSAISKTINVPESCSFEDFQSLYLKAFDLGLKGCTMFRPNPVTGSVLEPDTESCKTACL